MEAQIQSVKGLFSDQHRYVVPAYQRSYVWTEERQWLPLWEDLERIADDRTAGQAERHFLGAIVIRLENTPPGGITEWSVIDGQQRLTTLQILMAAIAHAASSDGVDIEAKRLQDLIRHDDLYAEGDDRFKFWPSAAGQSAFREVMSLLPPDTVAGDDPSNTIHEAWEFFRAHAERYANGDGTDDATRAARYAALREAVTGLMQLVTISLEKDDPAHVIFETLNARGTPLLAMDLVKNALFDAAEKAGVSASDAHQRYWVSQLGDDDYWSTDTRLGRVTTPRSEAFFFFWLTMRLGEVVRAEDLFEVFRRRVLGGSEPADPVSLIEELNADAGVLRGFDDVDGATAAGQFFATLRGLDTTTLYPLALLLFRLENLSSERRDRALRAIESFLVRRLLRGLTTKNYNNLVTRLIAEVRDDPERADERVVEELLASQADTSRWPTDDEMRQHLRTQSLYNWLGQRRIVFLLAELELQARRSPMVESIAELPKKLEIEHIMPRAWRAHWPLAGESDDDAVASREAALDLLGNLTLVAQPLNASMSNGPWTAKREALEDNSLLVLNKHIVQSETWDETKIAERGDVLIGEVLTRWRAPNAFMPEAWRAPEAESWPEQADMSLDLVETVYAEGSVLLRALLDDLAAHPGERRRYGEIESSLDWPRGRLPGVLGGYAGSVMKQVANKRPWRIHLDVNGVWWMWLDDDRAAAIGAAE